MRPSYLYNGDAYTGMYRESHYKDKTIMRASDLYEENSSTGKITEIWGNALVLGVRIKCGINATLSMKH